MLNPLEDSDWEPRPKKRGSPWPYLLLAAALGYGAYRSGPVQAKLNSIMQGNFSKEAKSLIQRAAAQAKRLRDSSAGASSEASESGEGSIDIQAAASAPAPEPAKVWTIRVDAYDLLALKPVKGLSVKLKGGGKVFGPKAKGGVFEFRVPRVEEGGYYLDVRLRGKPVRFIEDIADVPYRDHDEDRRALELEELKSEKILHAALRAEDVSGKLECPIVVLP